MAPYGDDITEGLPYALSNPLSSVTFQSTGESYDLSINGLPFFIYANDETPYRRQTAPYRKQQIDQTTEPGEQTLTGWWLRSQSSFHSGDGINFYDPAAGETVEYRFADSKGVNVWEKGQATLLKSVDTTHVTTGPIVSNGVRQQCLRSIQWTKDSINYNGALMLDEYDLDKVYPTITASINNKALTSDVATLTTTASHGLSTGMVVTITGVDATFDGEYTVASVPTATTFTYAKTASDVSSTAVSPVGTVTSDHAHLQEYAPGSGVYPIYSVCDDGKIAYFVTNVTSGTTKFTMYKKSLDLNADDSPTLMFDDNSTISNAAMEYVKERIVLCADNKVYEIGPTAVTLPTPLYTHPSTSYIFTSVTASGPAIYISGYNGIQSTILKFTLNTSGASIGSMPTLTSAVVAAEMPVGEIVHKIFYYLGYMAIGTNKGVRVASVQDDGSIVYGPLIVETDQPVFDFAAKDTYIWCAASVAGEPGLIRIDLSNEIQQLRFAWANDIYYAGVTGHQTTACAFSGNTDRMMFTTAYADATNGYVYCESASTLLSSGYITTGKIRYNTLENKVFKVLKVIADNSNGDIVLESVDVAGASYDLGSFAEDARIEDVSILYPSGAQESLALKITIKRKSDDVEKGAILKGYQLKALPALPRQRLIQYPLACFDIEKDKYNVSTGYEDSAYEKLTTLEALEDSGDSIRVEDFRTGEAYIGIIEEITFVNRTPSGKRFSGFGGVILVTIRTL